MRGWLSSSQHRPTTKKRHGSGSVVPQLIHQHLAVLGKLCLGLPEGKAAGGRGGSRQPEDYQWLHVHALQECQGEGQAGYGPTALEYLLVHLHGNERSEGASVALTPATTACSCSLAHRALSLHLPSPGTVRLHFWLPAPTCSALCPIGSCHPLISHCCSSLCASLRPWTLGLLGGRGEPGGSCLGSPLAIGTPNCVRGGGGDFSSASHLAD